MKSSILFTFFFIFSLYFSQQHSPEFGQMLKKEQQKFLSKMGNTNVNPNTLNYDLRYQRMDLSLDPASYFVSGSVTSHFLPQQNFSSIYFDLSPQLTVSQVAYHGNNLSFQQLATTKELKIDFPNNLPANVLDSLTIHYSGAPPSGNSAFSTGFQSGISVLSTLSEPYGAQDWFPTKQSLNDKIEKFDIKITTPSQYSVAANGLLKSETILPNNQKLTFWRTNYPITAYLVAISITNFTKLNDVIGNPPFPFVNYIYPSTASDPTSMANIEWTKQCMNTFEQYLGAYPFRNEKYGHMEFKYGGGMEHQTMTSMGSWSKQLIAHELTHQWFGDKLTCGSWNDIWLNEGFATFGEHLVNEKLLMNDADFKNFLLSQKNLITSSTNGSTFVSNANISSVNAIFNYRLSYAKGAFIVRMIKWILTDPIFYQSIKDYHQRPNLAYNYAVTDDLKASLLQSTNINFTEFFNDWLYGQGYPSYTVKWKQGPNQSVILQVSQTQSHSSVSFFEMPLPIKVKGSAGQILDIKPMHTQNNQYFSFPVGFDISTVTFNEDHQIIDKNSSVILDNTLSLEDEKTNTVQLVPNPANEEISVLGIQKSTEFLIYSSDGRLVKKGKYKTGEKIIIKNLSNATYLLKMGKYNFKFIKN